jgi:hypothetical protein
MAAVLSKPTQAHGSASRISGGHCENYGEIYAQFYNVDFDIGASSMARNEKTSKRRGTSFDSSAFVLT